MNLKPNDFIFYKKFLYEKAGLSFGEEKIYLVVSRLTPLAQRRGFSSLEDMTKALRASSDKQFANDIIDAMTTNETLFFRDDRPFKYFKSDLIPELCKMRQGRRNIRIWSAACSTGQEPYSIAMTLLETLPDPDSWIITILATDISHHALSLARNGQFNQFEIQRGMPIQMLMKYFRQEENTWIINDRIKKMIQFEHFNLLDSMEKFGVFDIIFCRNVLIYFDEPTKKKILNNMVRQIAADGLLLLGGAETAIGICPSLKINSGCPGLYNILPTSQADKTSTTQGPGKIGITA